MNTAQIWQTIIEAIMIIIAVVGIFNEKKIANWEQKMFKKIFKGGKH